MECFIDLDVIEDSYPDELALCIRAQFFDKNLDKDLDKDLDEDRQDQT